MKITFDLRWGLVLRWLIGLVLVWAALGKLANLQEFLNMLLAYRLPLPVFFLRGAAIVLPWLELLCGLMLLANVRADTALVWALFLFTVFTICTGQAWIRGLQINCGCLDLSILGIQHGSSTSMFLESVGFAFFRALALAAGASFLVFQHAGSPPAPTVSKP